MSDEVHMTNPNPFRDGAHFGHRRNIALRAWHARHLTAQRKYGYIASGLCGINLISGSDTVEGEWPPVEGRACEKCNRLTLPSLLPLAAFDALKLISQGAWKLNDGQRPLTQLYQRDLIDGYQNPTMTQLGWRWLAYCRQHPAFDPALRAV